MEKKDAVLQERSMNALWENKRAVRLHATMLCEQDGFRATSWKKVPGRERIWQLSCGICGAAVFADATSRANSLSESQFKRGCGRQE